MQPSLPEHQHQHGGHATDLRSPNGTQPHTASSPAPSDQPHEHDRHAGHSVEMFRERFWITLLLTIPTLVWSEMIQRWVGFTAPSFAGSAYVPALFGTAVICRSWTVREALLTMIAQASASMNHRRGPIPWAPVKYPHRSARRQPLTSTDRKVFLAMFARVAKGRLARPLRFRMPASDRRKHRRFAPDRDAASIQPLRTDSRADLRCASTATQRHRPFWMPSRATIRSDGAASRHYGPDDRGPHRRDQAWRPLDPSSSKRGGFAYEQPSFVAGSVPEGVSNQNGAVSANAPGRRRVL